MPNRSSAVFPSPDAEIIEVETYRVLAKIYDVVMAHVDFRLWTDYLLDMLRMRGLPEPNRSDAPRMLDCACGTGTVVHHLALRGYNVEGRDSSAEMIAAARRRVHSLHNRPRFAVKDFLELDDVNRYDAVLCIYDSVNYLLDSAAVVEYFARVRTALKPAGLFTFDICTEANSRRYFADYVQDDWRPGFKYRREAHYLVQERIQENRFWIELQEEPGRVYFERHRQRIYSVAEMRRMLAQAGLKILDETEDFSLNPSRKQSLRVHFVCGK